MPDLPSNVGLPAYGDLPVVDGARVSWGLWGDGDVLGCLNLLAPDRVRDAAALVERGAVFPLDAALDEINPPLFGRPALDHEVLGFPSGRAFDDHIRTWNTQASSQWDGLHHFRDLERGFYNGLDRDAHGIHHFARRGIVGRGVLVDVQRFRATAGRPIRVGGHDVISPADLHGALDGQGTEVRPGDVLLVHTGWLDWHRTLDAAARSSLSPDDGLPGLEGSEAMAETLWNLHVAAVAADNPALEAWPHDTLGLHTLLLPRLGIPIGELWDLGALAADCADDGRYEFLLTSAPLHLRGGVASPPNALAVK